ncbi:hypothetical protein [Silvibacterium acidisoli]|uniref:hypothetical protein n=1 Tax=Acidobacteriaceae bacterium ZG23-2 TaxID=2883246 RepID=UPI00406C462F
MLIHFPKHKEPGYKLLLVGDDQCLLESRKMLFEGSGYGVVSFQTKDLIRLKIMPAADLAVLCHSVRDDEWEQLIQRLKDQFSTGRILQLDGPSVRRRYRETQVMPVVPTHPACLLPILKHIVHKD